MGFQEIANATVLIGTDNNTVPFTYYNSTCMSYSEFCGQFGLSANKSDPEEVCYESQTDPTNIKKFTDLYKR